MFFKSFFSIHCFNPGIEVLDGRVDDASVSWLCKLLFLHKGSSGGTTMMEMCVYSCFVYIYIIYILLA